MLGSYLHFTFRSFKRNWSFSGLNLLGLSLGLSMSLMICYFVFTEYQFDKFNSNKDRIVRVSNEGNFGGQQFHTAGTPAILATILKTDYPEVEDVVRIIKEAPITVKKGKDYFREERVAYADSSLFRIFTLPLLYGEADDALIEPNSVVINESMARKYFPSINPVGESLQLREGPPLKITAVMKDIPEQSHFHFDFILSMTSKKESTMDDWLGSSDYNTYVLLKDEPDALALEKKLPALIESAMGPQLQRAFNMTLPELEKSGSYFRLHLMPLLKIHLHSHLGGELSMNGNEFYMGIYLSIALLILIVACFNFINLSTARFTQRSKEVGVRKVLGSSRKELVFQLMSETFVLFILSTLFALVIAYLSLNLFNDVLGKSLNINLQSLATFLPYLIAIVCCSSLFTGIYPAFFLSKFKPIDTLRGQQGNNMKTGTFRNILVAAQFAISIFLIISTTVIVQQLKFVQDKNVGYNREQIITIKNVDALGKDAEFFKSKIEALDFVKNSTLSDFSPTNHYSRQNSFFLEGVPDPQKAILGDFWEVDEQYLNTFEIQLLQGRNFSKDIPTDAEKIIINEATAALLGEEPTLNRPVFFFHGPSFSKFQVVGIVKNFNIRSLRDQISPMVLVLGNRGNSLNIKLLPGNMQQKITRIKSEWNAYAAGVPFDFSFMDDQYNALYEADVQVGRSFTFFTTLALFIACLGLFGLIAYTLELRVKEIGIRKVLGARPFSIFLLLTKGFITLIAVATLIASPLAILFIHRWLEGYAYRVAIAWWVAPLAGLLSILVALIVISYHAIRSSMTNPIDSINTE